jgi:hypothetical protein
LRLDFGVIDSLSVAGQACFRHHEKVMLGSNELDQFQRPRR